MQFTLQIKEREANQMFRNIGKKIKGLASVLFWIQAILYILTGIGIIIFSIVGGNYMSRLGISGGIRIALGIIVGLLFAGLGFLLAWLSQFILYGFGELIDKTAETEKNTAELKKKLESLSAAPAAPAHAAPAYAARPVQPQQPVRPAQPQQPAQPAYPPRPAQPTAPAAPAAPVYPSQPQQPGNTNLPR